jgi:hypothetical protein
MLGSLGFPSSSAHHDRGETAMQLVTTDAVSVLRFDDSAAQQRFVASFGDDAHAEGPIVLQYAAARTAAGKRAAYEARLREFLAEQG